MEHWRECAQVLAEKCLAPQGIRCPQVLQAVKAVPRHLFVPEESRAYSYLDIPLAIGEKQTISQPFMVARMTELLAVREGDKVLEIGTGSGYQAAILAEMGIKVTTIERIAVLAEKAKQVFDLLGYEVQTIIADGREGYSANAPYQGIIVTAGTDQIEESWLSQLALHGRIVVPLAVNSDTYRLLVRQKKAPATAGYPYEYEDTYYDYCRFVPLLSGVRENSTRL